MAKINPTKKIQRYRTEEEMRNALNAFCNNKHTMSIPPQDDDHDIVLKDAIEELLELRAMRLQVDAFMQSIRPTLQRR